MTTRVLHAVASVGDTYGGISTALAALGEVDAALGHDATLVTLDRPEQGVAVLAELPHRFDVHLVPPGRIAGRVHGGHRLTSVLRHLVPQHDLVVLHGVFDLASVVGGQTARRVGVPYLLWPHGSLDPYDLAKHRALKYRLASLWRDNLAGASALLCTTAREAERLVTFGATTRRVVTPVPLPDGAPAGDGERARLRWGLPRDARVVLFLGRIHAKKGLPLLLSGFAAAAGPRDVLVIAGTGDERLTRQLRAAAAALRDQVVFTGWVGPAERQDLLAAADVFALTSDNENFSVAVAEALAAGVAVLATEEVYLVDELCPVGAALVCDRTPARVAHALRRLLADEPLRHGVADAGRRWAAEQLTVRAVATRYRAVVEEAMLACPASVF